MTNIRAGPLTQLNYPVPGNGEAVASDPVRGLIRAGPESLTGLEPLALSSATKPGKGRFRLRPIEVKVLLHMS